MKLDEKIEIFSQRLAQDPHSRVFAPLADLLRQAGRLEDALELLDDGLVRHPDYISALVIKGRTLLDAGQMDHARDVLVRVMELDSENFVVLRLMTADARSRQAWDEAIPLLEKLVVLDPDDDRWPGALAEAREFARQEAASGPGSTGELDSAFTTMTLVDIYLAQGYRTKALEALGRMADQQPDRSDIRERMAQIEAQGPTTPPGPETRPSIPAVPATPAGDLDNQQPSRRSNEKKQFEEWLHRLRQDGGPSS